MVNRTKSLRRFRLLARALALAAVCAIGSSGAHAVYINDPSVLVVKKAMADAIAAQKDPSVAARQAQANAQAAEQADCTAVEEASRDASVRRMEMRAPPRPTDILKGSTCFNALSQIKIPINMTGIGLVDTIITSQIQKYMKGTCNASNAFVRDLQKQAVDGIKNSTGKASPYIFKGIDSAMKAANESAANPSGN